MVKIDGREYPRYNTDTIQTFVQRVASMKNTLPKYLYFDPEITDIKNIPTEIKCVDFLDILKNNQTTDLVDLVKEIMKKTETLTSNDIIIPFITMNSRMINMFNETSDGFLSYLSHIQMTIDAEPKISPIDIEEIWQNRNQISKEINTEITYNKQKVDAKDGAFADFSKMQNTVHHTEFELEDSRFILNLNMPTRSISEIFNMIQLSVGVPFASYNNFYKILKDFTPPSNISSDETSKKTSWSITLNFAIIFRILQKIDPSEIVKDSDYAEAVLTIDDITGEISVEMGLKTSNMHISRDKFIKRFFDIFKDENITQKGPIIEKYVAGVLYFPKMYMNKYIMADLVMNDEIFSSIFTIDESQRPTHIKESVFLLFNNSDDKITVHLSTKIAVKREELFLYGKGGDAKHRTPAEDNYVRAKITASNISKISETINILGRIMYLYVKDTPTILKIYKSYLGDSFVEKTKISPKSNYKQVRLKDIAPELFIKGYSQKCPQKPTIIDDSDVDQAKKEGKIVMRYPLENIEGLPARNYVCDHKRAIYPGLRDNPLKNEDLSPYLPCCYETNHAMKEGTIFRYYYHGEPIKKDQDTIQQDIIKTNRTISLNQIGVLPENIAKPFEIFAQPGVVYYRKGVLKTKSSFLECVMEGLQKPIIAVTDKEKRLEILKETRQKMATDKYAAACKQQMYDYTIQEIKEMIADFNVYFSPRLFVMMLEQYFKCNIYVFSRDKDDGQLILPRFSHALYKTQKIAKCVFIYEHTGSHADHEAYPRCELIISASDQNSELSARYENKVSMGIRSIYNKLRLAYARNVEIDETIFPLIENPKITLVGQTIDSYGKCRRIQFIHKNKTYNIFTNPIQPLALPLIDSWKITDNDMQTQDNALRFCQEFDITITGQNSYESIIYELYGRSGNVNVTIPIYGNAPLPNIEIYTNSFSYQTGKKSAIDEFNFYKKMARYVTEYMYWLFSKYLQANPEKSIHDINTIEQFRLNNIVIIPGFEYKPIEKTFSMDSNIMRDKKLVVKSSETLQKLMFILRLNIKRFTKKIAAYHTRTIIEHYYLDVSDFDQYHLQVILYGEDSIHKWINEQKIKHYIYDHIKPDMTEPYMFKNLLIDDRVYLVQNTDSIPKALGISKTWYQKYGYNPGKNPDEMFSGISFILYSYVCSNDITPYKVVGKPSNDPIKIIGCKIEDTPLYTVLLGF